MTTMTNVVDTKTKQYQDEAAIRGFVFVGNPTGKYADNYRYKLYMCSNCGNHQNFQFSQMRAGRIRCAQCFLNGTGGITSKRLTHQTDKVL